MIAAASHLAALGLTVADARAWVMSHLDSPALIRDVAAQFGVTTGMLAEIAGGGIVRADVTGFFAAHGIDAAALDAHQPLVSLAPDGVDGLADILALNTETGVLATGALRALVQAATGEAAYWDLFSPNRLAEAGDGWLSVSELGTDRLGTLAATPETIESLYFGTLLKLMSYVDSGERIELAAYLAKFGAEIADGDKPATAGYEALLGQALLDPAGSETLSDSAARDAVVQGLALGIELVGNGTPLDVILPLFNNP